MTAASITPPPQKKNISSNFFSNLVLSDSYIFLYLFHKSDLCNENQSNRLGFFHSPPSPIHYSDGNNKAWDQIGLRLSSPWGAGKKLWLFYLPGHTCICHKDCGLWPLVQCRRCIRSVWWSLTVSLDFESDSYFLTMGGKTGRFAHHGLFALLQSTLITLLLKLMCPAFMRLTSIYSKVLMGLNLTCLPPHDRYLASTPCFLMTLLVKLKFSTYA